ncbi:hypothetical protein [Metabacillus fastidiosus]
MEKKQYNFADLSDAALEQVNFLEKTLSEEKGEKVILIAYEDQQFNKVEN